MGLKRDCLRRIFLYMRINAELQVFRNTVFMVFDMKQNNRAIMNYLIRREKCASRVKYVQSVHFYSMNNIKNITVYPQRALY